MLSKKLLLQLLQRTHLKKRSSPDRLVFGLLAAGGALLFLWLVYLGWSSYSGQKIAVLLPQEKTSFYVVLKDRELPPKLKGSPLETLLLSKPSPLPPFAKKNIGFALVNQKPLLFFRATNRRQALNFLKELGLDKEKLENRGTEELPIYLYPQSQNFVFTFVGPYLLITEDTETIKMVHQVFKGEIPALKEDPEFIKSFSHLPKDAWISGYMHLNLFASRDPPSTLLASLKQMAKGLSFTVRQNQEGLHFNTFLSLQPEFLKEMAPFLKKSRFTYGLSEALPAENLSFYLGGLDLGTGWQNTLDTLNKLNPAYSLILEGILRAQVDRLFGRDTSLEEDVYPLFQGEYALAISPQEKGPMNVTLLLTHADKTIILEKLKKLREGFSLLAAQFTPQIKVVELPDGTISRELVADPDSLKEVQETYEDYQIDCVEVMESVYGFCHAVSDDLLILSNHLKGVKKTIDAIQGKTARLSELPSFRQGLSRLSNVSDEITFMDFKNTAELLKPHPFAALSLPYFEKLDGATWIKHEFQGGVSSEGFVLIK